MHIRVVAMSALISLCFHILVFTALVSVDHTCPATCMLDVDK